MSSPEESLEAAYETLRETLISQLIEMLKSVSPARFETIVIDVLQAMGYGGGRMVPPAPSGALAMVASTA